MSGQIISRANKNFMMTSKRGTNAIDPMGHFCYKAKEKIGQWF
jgi:hypothetical protein